MAIYSLPETLSADQVKEILDRPEVAIEVRRSIEEVRRAAAEEVITVAAAATRENGWCNEGRRAVEELSFVNMPYYTAEIPIMIEVQSLSPQALCDYEEDQEGRIAEMLESSIRSNLSEEALFDDEDFAEVDFGFSIGEIGVTRHLG